MTQFLRDITIRRMVIIAILFISFLVICLSALSARALVDSGQALDLSHATERQRLALARTNEQLLQARLSLEQQHALLAGGNAQGASAAGKQADDSIGLARQHFEAFRKQAGDGASRSTPQTLAASFDAMLAGGLEPLKQALAGGDVEAYRRANGQATAAASLGMRKAVADFDAEADTLIAASQARAVGERKTAMTVNVVVLVVCLLLLVLADRYIVVNVATPLNQVKAHFQRIASGDLTVRIDLFGKNCVGQIFPYLRDMKDSLANTVGSVREGVDQIHLGAAEIASSNADLSGRTEQQAASLEETASSMEELAATVKKNAESAHLASQMAATATDVARRGGNAVDEMVRTMKEISDHSQRIGEIVGVIDGIAFQTNILALNAAVEAARAGEQGKGFAVVASEVRALAQRSGAAAKEIKDLITASGETVAAGSQRVGTTGSTMQELVASVLRVSSLVGEIAAASGEQAAGIDLVNRTLSQMDQVTQQNAALVEEAAAAASSLEDQADRLNSAVGVFTLAQAAPRMGIVGADSTGAQRPSKALLPSKASTMSA